MIDDNIRVRSFFDKLVFASFLALVATLGIQKPAVTQLYNENVSLTDVVFPLVLCLALAGLLIKRRLPKWNSIYLFFGAYLLAFLVSSFFSSSVSSSLLKTFATAYLVGLAVISIELIDSSKRLALVIVAWLVGAIIPIVVGAATLVIFYAAPDNTLLPYVTYHHGAVPVGNFPRLSSTFVSASMFCNYLTATVMLLLAANRFDRIPSWIWWTLMILLCLCSVFTVSAGLGAFILGLALWFNYSNDGPLGRYSRIAGIVVFVASLFAVLVAFQPHSTAPYSVHVPVLNLEVFPSSRILVWTDALKTFANNFFFGSGPGTPPAGVIYQNTSGQFSFLTDAHNSFLNVSAQTGIVGLIAFVATVFALLRKGFAIRQTYALSVAFLCGFVLQGLTGSFEDARHLWVLIGMMVAAIAIESEEQKRLSAEI